MIKSARALLPLLVLTCSVAVAADDLSVLKKTLAQKIPEAKPDSITQTPISNLYQVVYGTRVFYLTKDGQFAVEGDILDLKQGTNLTENTRAAERLKIISKIPQDSMIVYSPKQVKHTLTVFTDIDCGFCRKMHRQMPVLQQLGIKVRYLFFPQAGIDTPSYNKAVTVWCSKNQITAMNAAKQGETLPTLSCDNPIKQHMDFASKIGIQGTPMLIMEDGNIVEGFSSVAELVQILDRSKPKA